MCVACPGKLKPVSERVVPIRDPLPPGRWAVQRWVGGSGKGGWVTATRLLWDGWVGEAMGGWININDCYKTSDGWVDQGNEREGGKCYFPGTRSPQRPT